MIGADVFIIIFFIGFAGTSIYFVAKSISNLLDICNQESPND